MRRELRGRLGRWLALLLLLALLPALPAAAAVATGEAGAAANPNQSQTSAGSFEVAPVRILGVPALVVASPQLPGQGEVIAARRRAEVIEGNLRLLYEPQSLCSVAEGLSEQLLEGLVLGGPERQRLCSSDRWGLSGRPDALRVIATPLAGEGVELQAELPGRSRPIPLLTVTEADARLHGLRPAELAADWRQLLERRLRHARRVMQPDQLGLRLLYTVASELLVGFSLALCLRWWGRTRLQLRQHLEQARADKELQSRRPRRLQQRNRLLAALVLLQLVIMTGLLVAALPGRIPLALAVLLQPLEIALKGLLVAAVVWVLRKLLHFLLRNWQSSLAVSLEQRPRREQRYRNLLQVGQRLLSLIGGLCFLALVVAGLPGLDQTPIATWLAGGALLGALALVFQGLLRDVVAGLVTLLDDHCAVGDVVEIDGFTGEVVDLGVLSTVLRTADQRLVVLPNSRCEALMNHTKFRSGIELTLPLDPAAPQLMRVMPVLEQECSAFMADPRWSDQLLEAPQLRGVKRVTPQMVELSIMVITRAGRQWAVERELLGRLISRLEREGLPLAATRSGGPD